MLALKQLPQSPKARGTVNYHGRQCRCWIFARLPSVNLQAETIEHAIILNQLSRWPRRPAPAWIDCEHATEMLRRNPRDFVDPGFKSKDAPYLGPFGSIEKGAIQWIHEQHLLSEHVRTFFLLKPEPALLTDGTYEKMLREKMGLDAASVAPARFSASSVGMKGLGISDAAAYRELLTRSHAEWDELVGRLWWPRLVLPRPGGVRVVVEAARALSAERLCVPDHPLLFSGEEPYSLAIA